VPRATLRPVWQTTIDLRDHDSMGNGMRLISSSLMQVSPELEEAGRSVGASRGLISRTITLPLIRPGTARHVFNRKRDPHAAPCAHVRSVSQAVRELPVPARASDADAPRSEL